MKDSLGLFGQPDDPDGRGSGGTDHTGEYDMAELRAALKTTRGDQVTLPRETVRDRRTRRLADEQRRRRRRRSSLIAVLVLAIIAGATFVLIRTWSTQEVVPPADFAGAGTTETIVKVNANDGSRQIGAALLAAKVVASVDAFVAGADGNDGMRSIQPGYYKVREGASVASTIAAMLDDANRVGRVELIPGVTLADTRSPSGDVTPGYVTQITQAACVPLNGASTCFTADQLWQVIRTGDVAALGLVEWAVPRVTASTDPDRRLEGMIAPGVYNIPPTDDPTVVLKYLLGASAVYWNTSGIATTPAGSGGQSPYQLAIIASLIEREAITGDMSKVSRVIQNRLQDTMRLQLDSTVNYWQGESQIATTEDARLDPNPYNTYVQVGLPPTPIGGIGPDALAAALNPAVGDWLYFVKVNPKTGQSCFSDTLEQHNACVEQARAAGVFG